MATTNFCDYKGNPPKDEFYLTLSGKFRFGQKSDNARHRDRIKIHTHLATQVNFRKIKLFSLSYRPPILKNEDVNMEHTGRKGISLRFLPT